MKTKINFCLLTLMSYVATSTAQQKLTHIDRFSSDYFGTTVDIVGNYLIAAADGQDKDENGENSVSDAGAAYIFEKNLNGDWVQKQKIVALDREEYISYGWTGISLSDNYALIGASYANTIKNDTAILGCGAGYLYEKNSDGLFVQKQKLIVSDATDGALLGYSVKLFNDIALLGAPSSWCEAVGSTSYTDAGSVYIFEKDVNGDWIEKQKLISSDRTTGDNFGEVVSIYGSHIVVGAYSEDEDELGNNTLSRAGSVYIFEKDVNGDWIEVQKIVAPDRAEEDFFGARVDIYQNILVVSSLSNDTDENASNPIIDAGAVYVYEKENGGVWSFKQKLVPSDRESIRTFGASVKVTDKYIIASNYYEQNGSTTTSYGSVYIFEKSSNGDWVEVKKLTAPDGNNGDMFGYYVSASNEHITVGSPYHDKDTSGENHKSNAGAAYVYNISELLSTKDVPASIELTVFPNPNNGSFTLEFGKRINGSITIIDVLGKVRHTEKIISDKLKINLGLPKGIYFANVKAEESSSVVKFVVE